MKIETLNSYRAKAAALREDRDRISELIKELSDKRYPITREINKLESIIKREEKKNEI